MDSKKVEIDSKDIVADYKRVSAIYFSPNGRTRVLAESIASAISLSKNIPLTTIDITLPKARESTYTFGPKDLVIFGFPTYAGKLPNRILPFIQTGFAAGGASALAVVTFGNRSFDNSLAELCATLWDEGFNIVGAAAFPTQHAFSSKLAAGRPTASDISLAEKFGKSVGCKAIPLDPSMIPGDKDAPYYTPLGEDNLPASFLKAKPITDANTCTHCNICVSACPLSSIDPEDPAVIPGICIKCHACINKCPEGAKSFTDPAFLSHRAMLEENFTEPKDPLLIPRII